MASPRAAGRGIFLDRDGVLCENRPTYVTSWDEFRWLPRTMDGLRILAGLQVPVIIVTNQSAVNRGLLKAADLAGIHDRMRAEIARNGGRIDAIYVCPHHPDEGCACRKPGQGLFHAAAADWGLDLKGSYLIGDSRIDLEAGWSLQMRAILVRTGQGQQTEAGLPSRGGEVVVADLLAAATWIERAEQQQPRGQPGAAGSPRPPKVRGRLQTIRSGS